MKASKKKSSSYQNKITCDQLKFLFDNGVKIYPISKNGYWYIEVDVYGKKKIIDKAIGIGNVLSQQRPVYAGVNWLEAIGKTMLFYYDKLKNGK